MDSYHLCLTVMATRMMSLSWRRINRLSLFAAIQNGHLDVGEFLVSDHVE
jgi:hypothetical protein